jgi:hypothetical protein
MTINDPRDDPQYRVSDKGYKPAIDKSSSVADPQTVAKFHEKSDLDSSQEAQHHSLGTKHDQAASGDHTHNGKNSRKILTGTTISGSRASGAALISVIDALEKLGATDGTVA